MPDRDIAEELREVLRLHALHMKSIMDRTPPPPTVGAPPSVQASAFLPAKPVAKFAKLMRAAM
jgi:hypothetical protein